MSPPAGAGFDTGAAIELELGEHRGRRLHLVSDGDFRPGTGGKVDVHAGAEADEPDAGTHGHARQAAKTARAKLIRKVYEVDALVCPKCGAQRRVIALIEDPAVIERIFSWLGLWHPLPACRPSPPAEHASLALAYHPVPDIA